MHIFNWILCNAKPTTGLKVKIFHSLPLPLNLRPASHASLHRKRDAGLLCVPPRGSPLHALPGTLHAALPLRLFFTCLIIPRVLFMFYSWSESGPWDLTRDSPWCVCLVCLYKSVPENGEKTKCVVYSLGSQEMETHFLFPTVLSRGYLCIFHWCLLYSMYGR